MKYCKKNSQVVFECKTKQVFLFQQVARRDQVQQFASHEFGLHTDMQDSVQ